MAANPIDAATANLVGRAMPSDLILKSMNALHRTLLTVSFGKLGWDAAGMPVLELTTTGRKSGEQRSVMLTSPVQQGDTLVIVASLAAGTTCTRPGTSTCRPTPR